MESLVLHGLATLLELFYPDSVVYEYSSMFPIFINAPNTTISASTSTYSLSDSLIRSSSNDSLSSSTTSSALSSRSSPTKMVNSNTVSNSANSSMLYSDSIRHKLKTELLDQLNSAYVRLFKTWKRDKSFADIWPQIDQISILYNVQLESLANSFGQHQAYSRIKGSNQHHLTFNEGELNSLDEMSLFLNKNNRLPTMPALQTEQEQQLSLIRLHFAVLQRKRLKLIHGWIETFYSDQNYIRSFL